MNQTQEQILHYARLFLQSRGYNGFSYRDIARKLDIKNAAIHNYYPKKEDLVATLLEESRKEINANFSRVVESGGGGKEQLQSYFDYTFQDYDNGRRICLPGSVIVYHGELPDKVQEQNLLLIDNIIGWFSRALKTGREQGEFNFSGSVDERADLIAGTLLGIRQLSTLKGRDTLVKTITLIKADLGWID
ncbi:TetR/AcrR family transcriptional regulator [Methanolobus profundi]|uniref:Transcriptional regulator, TetR family n=1 Tax=Methanolobus profundi TaxID=487685 RepID=A0A1I4UYV1_9EURY|nr:TetR/AcrR family transcriptional regulator [Methanolobus profundi]SFM93950.1 transcriptional regulator, TetR family [Methanolobus profundi]